MYLQKKEREKFESSGLSYVGLDWLELQQVARLELPDLVQSSPPGLLSPSRAPPSRPLPLPGCLLPPSPVPGAPAVYEVAQVSQGTPPPLASDGWSAQTNTVLAIYRGDLSTRVSPVSSTKPATDDVLVDLFTEEIVHPITALPDQTDLVGLDGKVADETHRLPL